MKFNKILILCITFISVGNGVGGLQAKTTNEFLSQDFQKKLSGVWKSIGYSDVIWIRNNMVHYYEINRYACLESAQSTYQELVNSVDKIDFKDDDKRIVTREKGFLREIQYEKLKKLPDLCDTKIIGFTNDPFINFKFFWNTFNENYAFFKLRNINWNARYDYYSSQITQNTTDDELFFIMSEMLKDFGDGHVELERQGELFNAMHSLRFLNEFEAEYLQLKNKKISLDEYMNEQSNKYDSIIQTKYLNTQFKTDPEGLIYWGKIQQHPQIAYMQINSLMGFSGSLSPDPENNLIAFRKVIDKIFGDLFSSSAVIIDLRANGGGFDSAALDIASRFTNKHQIAYTRQPFHKSKSIKQQKIRFNPCSKNCYLRPVYLLISEATASGAEGLAMIMKNLPNVTIIGENTNGMLSYSLGKSLPNGWSFELSNEIYRDNKGVQYEKTGVPPDYYIPFLSKSDRDSRIDSSIDKAIELFNATNE